MTSAKRSQELATAFYEVLSGKEAASRRKSILSVPRRFPVRALPPEYSYAWFSAFANMRKGKPGA